MNLLQVFFIVSGVIIFILAFDIARKEKFNALHFLVFLCIGAGLLIFTVFPSVLNGIGSIFGLQRGADALVYSSIVFLLYFSLLLLSKSENNNHHVTKLVRELAIMQSSKTSYSWNWVILIRVYNEEQVIEQTLKEVFALPKPGHTNILIIDDGSTDNSLSIINKFAEKHEHIIVVSHSQNRWGGAALETGFEYIRRYLDVKYVVTFDADGQHDIREVDVLKNAIWNHPECQVVFGSRFLEKNSTQNMPISRRCILSLGRMFTHLISGSDLSDPHNGYRIFRREALDKIHLTADSMAYASELVELIVKNKMKYGEVPVNIKYTEYSLSKWQKSSNAIFIWLHTIWKKFFM